MRTVRVCQKWFELSKNPVRVRPECRIGDEREQPTPLNGLQEKLILFRKSSYSYTTKEYDELSNSRYIYASFLKTVV